MVSALRKRPATYDDILAAPPDMVAEIIAGDLVVSPRPGGPHALAASALGSEVFDAFGRKKSRGGPGGWLIIDEPELHVAGILPDVYVPDLAGWRRERLAEVPQDHRFSVRPDWVCEVVSPKKRNTDLVQKGMRYLVAGVPWFWLVDPARRNVESYRLEDGRWVTAASFEGDVLARIPPFDAVELDLSEWWVTREPAAE